jgi:hypothetical protein
LLLLASEWLSGSTLSLLKSMLRPKSGGGSAHKQHSSLLICAAGLSTNSAMRAKAVSRAAVHVLVEAVLALECASAEFRGAPVLLLASKSSIRNGKYSKRGLGAQFNSAVKVPIVILAEAEASFEHSEAH